MDEFDGRDPGSDELGIPIEGGIRWDETPRPRADGMIWGQDQDPHDAFACPFCDTPVNLSVPENEESLVAECPSCENWFSIEEWRYYKQLVT